MNRVNTRADDDQAVRVLRFASLGHRMRTIEDHLGMKHNTASVLIRRVIADDLRDSGESEETVRAGYGLAGWRKGGA